MNWLDDLVIGAVVAHTVFFLCVVVFVGLERMERFLWPYFGKRAELVTFAYAFGSLGAVASAYAYVLLNAGAGAT